MPLKLVIRPKSRNWIIRGTVRGHRVEESAQTGDRSLAEEIRAKREAEIFQEAVYGRRVTATFAEAALSYLENGGSKRFLEPIIQHFGTTPLAKIDQDSIDRGARKLYPGGAEATRNRQFFTPVSAVLKHAARRGWCSQIIIERPRMPRGRERWLTVEEAERLITASGPQLRPLVEFLFLTGARIGEALWLDWRDVDLARRQAVFRDTKNGETRGVPLHPRLLATLANLPHRDGCVFRRPDGLPNTPARNIDDTSAGSRVKNAFAGACRRAGLSGVSPHTCRHTWASWHYAQNRDLGALMRLGGWRTVAMVMRYAHVNVAELAPSIDRLLSGGKQGEAIFESDKIA
jgi:integrase